jgi:ankyrin repeat protein
MQDDESALARAVRPGYANIARSLLENGATMDFEDEVRRTDMIIT